jgi:hypothetical protein
VTDLTAVPDEGPDLGDPADLPTEPLRPPPTFAGLPCREEEPVAAHLPLRGAGAFERWVEVADEAALIAVIRAARAEKLTIRPVAPFGDALPPEGGLTGVALRLGVGFEGVEVLPDGTLRLGAAAPLARAGRLPGFEALARAPGALGDAWEDGWIAPAVVTLRRYRGRSVEEVEDAAPDPKALVVSAVLRPGVKLAVPAAGQAFREPKRRGLALRDLLRRHGLAGLRLGGAMLAKEDPAVLVNRGDASPRQLRLVLAAARERVHTATGLTLEDRLVPPGRGGRL